jgi:hypothetical protein
MTITLFFDPLLLEPPPPRGADLSKLPVKPATAAPPILKTSRRFTGVSLLNEAESGGLESESDLYLAVSSCSLRSIEPHLLPHLR